MSSPSAASGRRRSNMSSRQYSAEDQALTMISKEAEARLAAKRAARAEAREIRMKEIEKQQKQSEEKQDRVYELTSDHAAAKVRQQLSGSRRGSTESTDSASDVKDVDFKAEVRELEEKYKAAMMSSAQLDNEKQSLIYQVELLKDQMEDQEEGLTELQREYKDKCRECDFQKRDLKSMEHELSILKQQLEIKDRLIEESGFVIMANDKGEPVLERQSADTAGSSSNSNGPLPTGAFLVSPETKGFLEKAGGGTLGTHSSPSVAVEHTTTKPLSVDSKLTPDTGSALQIVAKDEEGKDFVDSSVDKSAQSGNVKGETTESRAGEGAMHENRSVITSTDVVCEHGLITPDLAGENGREREQSVDEKGLGEEGGGKMEREDSGVQADVPSISISSSKSKGGSLDEESDEGDEFYDAISLTPSPFDKKSVTEFSVPVDPNEGSSVDEELVVARDPSQRVGSHDSRQSVELKDVTVTESRTEEVGDSVPGEDEPTDTVSKLDGSCVDDMTEENAPSDLTTDMSSEDGHVEEMCPQQEKLMSENNNDQKMGKKEDVEGGEVNEKKVLLPTQQEVEKVEVGSLHDGSPESTLEELDDLKIVESNDDNEEDNNESSNDVQKLALKERNEDNKEAEEESNESVQQEEKLVSGESKDDIKEKEESNDSVQQEEKLVSGESKDDIKEKKESNDSVQQEEKLVSGESKDDINEKEESNDSSLQEETQGEISSDKELQSASEEIEARTTESAEQMASATNEAVSQFSGEEETHVLENENEDGHAVDTSLSEQNTESGSKESSQEKSLLEEAQPGDMDAKLDAESKQDSSIDSNEGKGKELSEVDVLVECAGEVIDSDEVKQKPPPKNESETESTEASVNQSVESSEGQEIAHKSAKKSCLQREASMESEEANPDNYDFDDIDDVLDAVKEEPGQTATPEMDQSDVGGAAAQTSSEPNAPSKDEASGIGEAADPEAGSLGSPPPTSKSMDSLEPDDLEGALDKSMKDKEQPKGHKKSKKFKFFKKVFK